jgi:very-short-patch-repair endonuclease/predicted transcriptional regulator of viral defense system
MADTRCIEHHSRAGCSTYGVDRSISALAEGQHGVVARRQLLEMGMSRRAIGGRLERGLLHPVHLGVYAVGYRRISLEGRWMAAVLACGSGAVLSHRSAGQLWGILPRTNVRPQVTRPTAFRTRPGITAHRARIPEDETTRIDGIPVTGLARTLLDLAAILPPRQVEQALNEAEVLGLTDRLSLPQLLARYPRRHGTAFLRTELQGDPILRGITKGELEARFKALLDAADLPRPRLNADVAVQGRFFTVDCLWQEQRLIVELDGRAVHGTPRAFERDRERDRLLMVEGWRVVRVTWRQLRDDSAAVLADLRRLLRG